MSVLVVLVAILASFIGLFIAINSTDTKARISGMALVAFVVGFLAAGAALPQRTVVKYESDPNPVLLKGCFRISIVTDTTHDNPEEENSLGELEEAGRQRGCSVNTVNTNPPKRQVPPRRTPPPDTKLPEEGIT